MQEQPDRLPPLRRSKRRLLAAEAARQLRLLSLSEGLSFCVLLHDRRDPQFEQEMKRWLELARRESVLSSEDAELLGAVAAPVAGEFVELPPDVIERTQLQLRVEDSPSVNGGGGARPRLGRRSTLETAVVAPRPAVGERKQWPVYGYRSVCWRPLDSPATRFALVAAAACLALGVSVVGARGDAQVSARGDPEAKVTRRRAASLPQNRCKIPTPLRDAFVVAAKRTDLPLSLLVALARAESQFDSTARSNAGAVGVLQLMPATARAMGLDPHDPDANVLAGARYLSSLMSRFGSSQLALAAYNAGPTSVAASGGALDKGTRAYVANVKRIWRSLGRCR